MKKVAAITTFFFLIFTNISSTAQLTRVQIRSISGYNNHADFASAAALRLEQVINSLEFRNEVTRRQYAWNQNKTSEQIFNSIMLAREVDGEGGSDSVVDLRLRVISRELDGRRWMRWCRPGSWAGTYGKDGGGSGVAAICPQRLEIWHDANDTASLAAHFIHEYMHILGFTHPNSKPESVPYQIGNIVERLIRLNGGIQ